MSSEIPATMRAARMHGFHQPLVLEEVPVPEIGPDEVLIKVGAAGLCRTDVQLIDGYFNAYANFQFPLTPGHEIAGEIVAVGAAVGPSGHRIGDQVVVVGGRGDGTCRLCHQGDTQICPHLNWPGFGPHGGYAEYVPMPTSYVITVNRAASLAHEQLAPLTDAGLTPYRGVKKLRDSGVLVPGTVLGVMGVSALGTYAVQYAKLFSGGAQVVAFARNQQKLEVAKRLGADHVINIRDRSIEDVRGELRELTGIDELAGMVDCAGAPDAIQLGVGLLARQGRYVTVGLVGDQVNVPLFPMVGGERSFEGSFWGNYNDLDEVVKLAEQGGIQDTIHQIRWEDVNETIDAIRAGDIVGRAVIKY